MGEEQPSRIKNLSYAVLAGQAGCTSLVLIFAALGIGLWLDAQFGLRGPFTIGLLLLSIPISLFAMVRLALGMISQIKPQPNDHPRQRSSRRGDL